MENDQGKWTLLRMLSLSFLATRYCHQCRTALAFAWMRMEVRFVLIRPRGQVPVPISEDLQSARVLEFVV